MEEFKELIIRNWPDIVSFLSMFVAYFLIFLYKYSTRNLNLNLKTIFKENSDSLKKNNDLFEERMNYQLKQARDEYLAAMKLCESYEKKIDHLEKTLNLFLHEGDEL